MSSVTKGTPEQKLDIDFEEARRFLNLICDGTTTFQVFHDKAKEGPARHKTAEFDSIKEQLATDNQHGLGVFVQINEGDGLGRKAENITRIRALFVDLDGAPLAPVLECGLKPHCIVESSPGRFHAYWLVDGCPLTAFRHLQRALARRFNGDLKICDLARVMRLPGFYHLKGGPFRTRIIQLEEHAPYELGELVEGLELNSMSDDEPSQPQASQALARLPLEGPIPEGSRNDSLYSAARQYFEQGHASDEVLKLTCALNSERCSSPLSLDEVKTLVNSAAKSGSDAHSTAWPSLVSLQSSKLAPEAFPIDALPGIIKGAVQEYQSYGQQPLSLVAYSALTACSLSCQGLADVSRDGALRAPLSLNFIVIAESGERKTAADKVFTAPLREWDAKMAEEMAPVLQEYNAMFRVWEAAQDVLVRKLKKNNSDITDLGSKMHAHEKAKPTRPVVPRILYEQITSQALIQELATGWPSAGLCSDEGGIVIGAYSMGNEQAMASLALLNKLWDGAPVRSESKHNGRFLIMGRRLTLSLMMQECVIETLLSINGGIARGTGLLARALITYPTSTIGRREYSEPGPMIGVNKFCARVTELLSEPLRADPVKGLNPELLHLNPAAKDAWVRYLNAVEAESGNKGKYHRIKDFASKSADIAARLAGIFHIFCHRERGNMIQADDMQSAIELTRWALGEAARTFDIFAVPMELTDARKLLDWLISFGAQTVDARMISQKGPYGVRAKKRRDAALEILRQHGMIKRKGSLITIRPELVLPE